QLDVRRPTRRAQAPRHLLRLSVGQTVLMAGSLRLGVPVSTWPARRRRYVGSVAVVIETSYQPLVVVMVRVVVPLGRSRLWAVPAYVLVIVMRRAVSEVRVSTTLPVAAFSLA